MSKANKGTQTSPVAVFRVEKAVFRGPRSQAGPELPRRVCSPGAEFMTGDVEDLIIDGLLKDGMVESQGKSRNVYVRSPFKRQRAFSLSEEKRLVFSEGSEFETIQRKFKGLKTVKLQEMLQDVSENLVTIVTSPEKFFDRFWKAVYRPKRTVLFGVASFSFWAAQFLKKKFANFIFETLVVFLGFAVQTRGDWQVFFPTPQPAQQSLPENAEEFKKFFLGFFGPSKPVLLDIPTVLRFFSDYLAQNDFFDQP